jgi:transposase
MDAKRDFASDVCVETMADMQDRELYRQILGIESPWFVERVELQLERGEIHVHLGHQDTDWPCAECGQRCGLYDHQPDRQWRHLDTCQYQTILHASPPRSDCGEHGPRVVKLPWAEAGSRFTALFEALAIEWLKQASQAAVAAQLRLSWDEIHTIQQRAVRRGLQRRVADKVRYIGVDEKAYKTGHSYLTLVNDLERGRVLFVAEEREEKSLDAFWPTLTAEQVEAIEAVAIDMWDAYVNSLKKHLPDAEKKIVFDKFHIAQHLTDAIDRVRRKENKALLAKGDKRLKGTRWHWLKNPANMASAVKQRFAELKNSTLQSARAWALKQVAMQLFNYVSEGWARRHFQWWYSWAIRSRLEPIKKVARMLKRRFENIITYLRHRITNAGSESINAKLQWVKYTARGFRNKQNFITAIYFHCGGLDLSPVTH